MPLLIMRTYPNTLLDESCRLVVRRQMDYAAACGVPWGISESAYNLVDRHGNYQYKAFGIPGLGLKRGLGDEVVVAPYATALAVMIDPAASTANLRRLAAAGLEGEYGFFDAIDYTHRGPEADCLWRREAGPRRRRAGLPGPSRGDDPGRADQCARWRSHDRTLSRGAESPGDRTPAAGTRAARGRDHRAASARRNARRSARGVDSRPPLSPGAHDVPAHAVPLERQLRHVGDQCRRRRQRLARTPGDQVAPRCHARRGRPVHLPARRAQRRRLVRDLSAVATRARRLRGDVFGRPRELPAARRRRVDRARHRGLDRRRRRGAADRGPQPRHAHPRARRDELRRDRPHLRRERSSPTRRSANSSSRPSICRRAPPCCVIDGRAIPAKPGSGRFTR